MDKNLEIVNNIHYILSIHCIQSNRKDNNMACITKKRNRDVIDFYDQHGKRRLKTLPKGITLKNAKKVLREIEQEVEKGVFLTTGNAPVFSDVAKNWLEYKKPNIRQSTFIQYEGHINNHLTSYFGATKINRINFHSIEKYLGYATAKEVTPPTLRKILISLGGILKYSVRKRYIDSNPIREIDKPKNKSSKKEVDFLKPEEIRSFIDNTDVQKYKIMFLLAVMSGMRQGELLGLQWDDIDWFNSQVRVKRTFNHGGFFPPKSETSKRAIDLSSMVIKELKKWQLACLPNELNLVFPSQEGKPMDSHNMVNRHFHPALKRAKLRRIRFHDLRHTYAALLIDQEENPKYIQTQMGHASISITMDVYGHLMNSVNREASNRLEIAVFGESGDILETQKEKHSTLKS